MGDIKQYCDPDKKTVAVEKYPDYNAWLIRLIYIPPADRGQGIFKKEMQKIISDFKKSDYNVLALYADPLDSETDKTRLIAGYKKFGFNEGQFYFGKEGFANMFLLNENFESNSEKTARKLRDEFFQDFRFDKQALRKVKNILDKYHFQRKTEISVINQNEIKMTMAGFSMLGKKYPQETFIFTKNELVQIYQKTTFFIPGRFECHPSRDEPLTTDEAALVVEALINSKQNFTCM